MHYVSSPYEYSELEYLRRRRIQQNVKVGNSRENLFPMPSCIQLCSNWKLWAVLTTLASIICIIFIVIWINWNRSHSGYVWGDEGPLGPEQPPAICYKCNNYAHIMDGRELNSNVDIEHGDAGGAEIGGALGVAVEIEDPRQELCQEFVNQTALAETQAPDNDDCGDSLYNGCFKMVTKAYRMTSNIGHELLSVTIVTRNCVEIPKTIPAQTKENVTQIIQGHNDTPLTSFGEHQAAEVGKSLSNLQIDKIFTSDLRRCLCTAQAIQKAYVEKSISLTESQLMRERNFGLNNGKSRSEVHDFIALAKASHRGCEMWREIQGECGHQIFWRAVSFFFELCEFAAMQSTKVEPDFFTENSPENSSLPVLLPLYQAPVPQAFKLCQNQHQQTNYKGHFVLVSHGQWIREFNYILYALSEKKIGFPLHRQMVAVLSNCQFNQFGVAVDYGKLSTRISHIRNTMESTIKNKTNPHNVRFCPFDLSNLAQDLPIFTVCYHARVDADSVKGGTTSSPPVVVATRKEEEEAKNVEKSNMVAAAAAAGSGVETLYFAREDDEYAGLPEVK
nr:fructose 26 bisphosphatase TIGAR [Hymenolepis microstoma]